MQNRLIKFRGKRLIDGKWIYGVPYLDGGRHIMIDSNTATPEEGTGSWSVDPATVGQFTGLTDKNGKEIFEGDIITDDENFGLVIFNLGFDIEFYGKSGSFTEGGWNEDAGSYGIIETTELNEQVSEWATVLRNIHDDEELLKNE